MNEIRYAVVVWCLLVTDEAPQDSYQEDKCDHTAQYFNEDDGWALASGMMTPGVVG